jgi:C-terminal processing protease CtpA/Prc
LALILWPLGVTRGWQSFLKNSPAELTKQIAVGDCIVEVDKYAMARFNAVSSLFHSTQQRTQTLI